MKTESLNPLAALIARQGLVILDGGLATTLEDRGFDLDDPLWSARLLLKDPTAVRIVHEDFLRAGADVITTATYQASLPGFAARGLGIQAATALIEAGVELSLEARDRVMAEPSWDAGRARPLVAASVGSYGAFLADGSEYDGCYGVSPENLKAFHGPRWEILAGSGADLLACETLPSLPETEVLLALLAGTPGRWAWFSFCCRDGGHLWDGTPVDRAVAACHGVPGVAAVGINCTGPEHVAGFLANARKATDLPLLVYPNSGEIFDPDSKNWKGDGGDSDPLASARDWMAAGAVGLGGCCRIGPGAIGALRDLLMP